MRRVRCGCGQEGASRRHHAASVVPVVKAQAGQIEDDVLIEDVEEGESDDDSLVVMGREIGGMDSQFDQLCQRHSLSNPALQLSTPPQRLESRAWPPPQGWLLPTQALPPRTRSHLAVERRRPKECGRL